MNKATKRIFAIVLAIGVCFHFFVVFIYSSHIKLNSKKLDFISRLYVYPVFHQNWALFVPAPNVERKLFVRFKINNQFCDWQDILQREILLHRSNRLSGGEAKVLLLSNSLIYELNYLDEKQSFVTAKMPTNKEFEVLRFEIEKYLKSRFNCNNTSYELLLVSEGADKTKAYYVKSLSIN